MDYTTLQSRVADYLDRDDLTTKIQGWINDTRKDIALEYRFNYLYQKSTCQTSAGSADYALPSDYLGHLDLFIGNKKLMRISAREADELGPTDEDADSLRLNLTTETGYTNDGSGTPDYYIDRGMQFELWPTPDATYTITLKYYALPTDFSAGGNSDYISTFHFEAIIFGAALRGAVYLDDEQKKLNFSAAYDSALKKMLKREKDMITTDIHPRMKNYQDFDLDQFKRIVRVYT